MMSVRSRQSSSYFEREKPILMTSSLPDEIQEKWNNKTILMWSLTPSSIVLVLMTISYVNVKMITEIIMNESS